MNDSEIFLYITVIIIFIIAEIAGKYIRRNRANSSDFHTLPTPVKQREKMPIEQYMALHFPEFDAKNEAEKIGGFLENYLWAVSDKKQDLASFRSICSNGVITEMLQDIATNKLGFSSVDVTSVRFTDYEILGNETTLICIASVDYTAGEKNAAFEAKYKIKYSRVIREAHGSRISLKCPHCSAPISAEAFGKKSACEFCGGDISSVGQERQWTIVNIDRTSNRLKYFGGDN